MITRSILAFSLFAIALLLKFPEALEIQPSEAVPPNFLQDRASSSPTPASTPAPSFASPTSTEPLDFSLSPQPDTRSDLVQINTCNGKVTRANFRELPTLDSSVILGEVRWGDSVRLKGRVIRADGMMWHEAVAPSLVPSRRPAAQNKLEPGQTGWIADCFVNNEFRRL